MIRCDPALAAANPDVLALYRALIAAWNDRSAANFAACFTAAGSIVGFDGSQMDRPAAIEAELSRIFQQHKTARFVTIVREIRPLGADAALLRAVAGMAPEGAPTLNPAVNAVQSLVAQLTAEGWKAALFQNTPAAFHGRPELAAALSRELQETFDALSKP